MSSLSRRSFLRVGFLGGVGLSLSECLRLRAAEQHSAATADRVMFVNLAGGPSHLDTLDVKPEGPAETRGEFGVIRSKIAGLPVCEHLPKFAAVADRFSLIRGISHTSGSHPLGQSYISTGNRPTPALIYPSLGSVVGKQLSCPPDLPPYVAIPKTEWNAGYFGDAYAPFKTNATPKAGEPFQVRGISLAKNVSLEKVQRRQKLLKKIDRTFRDDDSESKSQLLEALDKFGRQAHQMITSKRARESFETHREPESIRQLFAKDELGQSLLLGLRLLESGVRFVTVTNQGWDTHLDNFKGHRRLIPPLDAGLAGLIAALDAKGMWERTLIIVMGEFGRTPKINVNTGRDHYPRVNWCLATGGGVQPGRLVGGTDKGGEAPDDGTHIQPDDVAATIYHSLGIDPRSEYHTSTGRPVMLAPHGRVIKELF